MALSLLLRLGGLKHTMKKLTAVSSVCLCFVVLFVLFKSISHTPLNVDDTQSDDPEPDEHTLYSFVNRLRYYPRNGTGISVNISDDFDPKLFNSFCKRNAQLKAVLPMYSVGDRFKSRTLLRDSLGRLAQKLNCKLFFVIGVSLDTAVHAKLQEEYSREQDILMVAKVDTYRDMNNKAFAMMEWISRHCTNVPYIIHLIDDSYTDIAWFLKRLESIDTELYMLAPMSNTSVVRTHIKSVVTVEEYPFPRFPIYAYGWAYAFPSRVASRLLAAVYDATYCWIEDVWIGGHVRILAGVELIPVQDWMVVDNIKHYHQYIPTVRVLHGVHPELLHRFYRNALLEEKRTSSFKEYSTLQYTLILCGIVNFGLL